MCGEFDQYMAMWVLLEADMRNRWQEHATAFLATATMSRQFLCFQLGIAILDWFSQSHDSQMRILPSHCTDKDITWTSVMKIYRYRYYKTDRIHIRATVGFTAIMQALSLLILKTAVYP